MASVSQNGRRARRPWTDQDQVTAEVMAACGIKCKAIARYMGRSDGTISAHLIQGETEKIFERNKRYYYGNLHEERQRRRRYYQSNINIERERSRLRYRANPEIEIARTRRWQEANPEKALEIRRRVYQNNPGAAREKCRRRREWRRASRRAALHPVTRAQIDARFALWSNRCAFCGVDATDPRNHGRERLTVEHVLALTKGGLDEASNIIPACTACNSSKNNSPIEDWYRQQEWFTEARWAKIQKHCPAAVVGQLPLALAA
jgi:5-methylcytosine-specific restriction endonuclease McrA